MVWPTRALRECRTEIADGRKKFRRLSRFDAIFDDN